MKLSKTVPPGPRVVPLEEHQAHALDNPANAGAFFAPFLSLQKQAETKKPEEYRCSFIDSKGCQHSLGTHSGTLAQIAGKIKTGSAWQDVEYCDKTEQLFLVWFHRDRADSRYPVAVERVKDETQDPTSHHFCNMNRNPLPLVPKPAPLGLPKSAPPVVVVPFDAVAILGKAVAKVINAQAEEMNAKAKGKWADWPSEYGSYNDLARILAKVPIVHAWRELSPEGTPLLMLSPDPASVFVLYECRHHNAPAVPVWQAVLAASASL
jgi:hypothetical protein